ncbi:MULTISPECIES: dipeptidase [unclassified Streptomyces]|uniref:dipeptidase n=1 Tax=unclassified Streptomyces TaxID=2593676 RepID=UPI000F4D4C44|nr:MULTISPECIES: dipeptidase [unclassified Streptomyces]MDH6450668.1 microsomal dipeptidase-like Zn-dependent dipeptidase [Streptomyces sp. SAI-119]MDH6498787.1 microsomal dipeptidase-like Zn-dependent dipeptidase [Streptomyces sp. SAI-149]QUC62417.1 dipeptidase [Streptomyces sp. A2-16]
MADLQDELHPPAGVEELPQLFDAVPELYTPVSDPDAEPLERARAILAAHPVADGYSGLPWALRHLPWFDLELGESAVDTDVPRLREGHVGALMWSLHLPEGLDGDRAVGATLEQLDLVKTVVRNHPEGLRLARTAGETTDARNCGRAAVLLGPAGAAALGDSLGILRSLHALGLRALTLSGVSWASEAGLTRFGEEVLREMNRLGVLPDLSGASEATIRRALAVSKAPLLFTRSAARALRPHPANLPDDLLAELGAAKGLCMVPLTAEQTGPTVRDVADHLDHVRAVAGAECVGLSGTYDAGTAHPQELGDASCYPHLVAELLRRDWDEADLALLTWGNVQRVLRESDFTARAAQQRREPSTAKIAGLDG